MTDRLLDTLRSSVERRTDVGGMLFLTARGTRGVKNESISFFRAPNASLEVRMPEIARFYGIVITLYYADHEPPHFHARYQEHEALYRIDDGAILRGALPERAARLVSEWAAIHGQDLALDWQLAREGRPLLPIEPLR